MWKTLHLKSVILTRLQNWKTNWKKNWKEKMGKQMGKELERKTGKENGKNGKNCEIQSNGNQWKFNEVKCWQERIRVLNDRQVGSEVRRETLPSSHLSDTHSLSNFNYFFCFFCMKDILTLIFSCYSWYFNFQMFLLSRDSNTLFKPKINYTLC